MKNINKLKEEYKILQEQVEKMGKEIKTLENKNPLMPKMHEIYYCIGSYSEKTKSIWLDDNIDNMRISLGNIFLTEEARDKKILKLKAIQKIKSYIAENCPFEPDWNDKEQDRYNIYYNIKYREYSFSYCSFIMEQTEIGFLKSEENCQTIINKFKPELDIIFNIK